MRLEFATAARILFGSGVAREIPSIARDLGRRALLVTGRRDTHSRMLHGLDTEHLIVDTEPTIEMIAAGTARARSAGCDLVVACGGGSVIDAGKAIAAMLTNPGDLLDYLEVIGRGTTISQPAAPFLAIPTTAGTGAEVTRNAVLAAPEHRVKASLRSPFMLPRVAVVDPELTLDLPPALTASTGLDALTQLIEPYVSSRANPLTDLYCREGISRVARSLREAVANGRNLAARTDMAWASLLGGLALANAGLGVVHGFAAPIGGMFPAPHGAVCAAILPHGMTANISTLRRTAPEGPLLQRFTEIARLLTGSPLATPEEGIAWVTDLCRDLRIPPLRAYGIQESDISALVEKATNASSMKANPVPLSAMQLAGTLRAAL